MEVIEFLNHPEIWEIVKQNNNIKLHKRKASYNLFTISSYNSYLENFHSDIIASLLNPVGLHLQDYTFLHLFIDYLNTFYNVNISKSDFVNSIVSRETGKIDIWIRDDVSKQSIIIENKINNAVDMENQIDRYFSYAQNARNYNVNAIVYLSLDGSKKAPATIENLDEYVRNIGAFTNSESDLVYGWLMPCLEAHANHDSLSVIHQYIKLIKHLANHKMDTTTMDSYYQFLNTENGFEIANTIVEMNNRIENHRVTKFANSITDKKPFNSQSSYLQNGWLFIDYIVDNNKLKLDILFYNDGSACVVFWNPSNPVFEGRLALTKKLEAINMLTEFGDEISNGGNGYRKDFKIGSTYKTMNEVDEAVIKFVNTFLKELQTT